MNRFKKILGVVMMAAVCVTLTACMGSANVRPQATTQTNYVPEATNNPANTNMAAAQNTQEPTTFDWTTGAGQIEANVNKISEIADSRVVVTGTTALVGVKFTDAYQGEVTERIREMVAAEVMQADPNIQTVAVTAEENDVTQVYDISDKVRNGDPIEELGNKIEEIVRNATTLR